MRVAVIALPILLAACASGPAKPPSCDGTNMRPINAGYPATYAQYLAQKRAALAPKGAGSLSSATLKLSVVLEKDSLVLLFTEPPASLFISDRKAGKPVDNVEWVSDSIIRVPLGAMSEIEFKTPAGSYAVKVDGGQLFEAGAGTA